MPAFAAIDQQNNNLVIDARTVGIVATPDGEVAALINAVTGQRMMPSPKALFECKDTCAALKCVADFYDRAKTPGFTPARAQWPHGSWVGGAVLDTAIPAPKLVTS